MSKTKQESQEPNAPKSVMDVIKELPNAPDKAQMDQWKAQYGAIFAVPFSEDEIYIFRPVTRSEWKQIQIREQEISLTASFGKEAPKTVEDAMELIKSQVNSSLTQEDETAAMCLLWPSLTAEQLGKKGGTSSTLVQQIMASSNFTTPQQAIAMVYKL